MNGKYISISHEKGVLFGVGGNIKIFVCQKMMSKSKKQTVQFTEDFAGQATFHRERV